MKKYQKKKTPLGNECEVREVPFAESQRQGRRWHVKVTRQPGTGPSSFYLWADRHLPTDADEDRIMRGVLNGVDRELTDDRSRMAADYDSSLLPDEFER